MADSKVVPVDSVVTIPRRPTQEVMEAGARALASARIANLHRNENVLACEVFATMIQAWLETHPSMLSAAPAEVAQTVVDVTGPDEMGSMYVRLRPMADGCVKQTRQIQANADYDSDRNLLGVEILSAHVIASPAPAARSDAGLVERLRAGCPLIPESESPDEDMFDYEASNKLMLDAAAALERQGEPVEMIELPAFLRPETPVAWRRKEGNAWWVYYETDAHPDLEPLYARPAIGGVEK